MTEQITVPKQTWDAMVEALEEVLQTVRTWNNSDDLLWIQYKLPEVIAAANAVSEQPPQHLQDYARLMESHIAVMQDNARLREALRQLRQNSALKYEHTFIDAALAAANAVQPQAQVEELVREIHQAVKRGRSTDDHGLMGNLRCILDHVLPDPDANPQATEPAGWKLVPVEPTLDMLAALGFGGDKDVLIGHANVYQEMIDSYSAMLAAAPEAP